MYCMLFHCCPLIALLTDLAGAVNGWSLLLNTTSTRENEHFLWGIECSKYCWGAVLKGTVSIWTFKWCQVICLFIYALAIFNFCSSHDYSSKAGHITIGCNFFWHLEFFCHSDLCSVILILQCWYLTSILSFSDTS